MRKEIRPAEDCWQWPHDITCFKDLVISSFPPHTPSQMDTSKLESFVLTTIPQFTIAAIFHTWTFCLFFFFSNISFCIGVEKVMAPHSSTLAWKIPWTEEPGRLQSMGSWSQTWLSDFTFTFHFLALKKELATHSCSCVENPRDGRAWWAAVYGITPSRTRLKWLCSKLNHNSDRCFYNISCVLQYVSLNIIFKIFR